MKKIFVLLAIIMACLSLYCTKFTLDDYTEIECDIVGKSADTLYIYYNTDLYKISKEKVINISNGGGNIKVLEFRKDDWQLNRFDIKTAKPFFVTNDVIQIERARQVIEKPKNITIDEMTDREFQVYLAQLNQKALEQHSKKITNTLWGIFGTSIGASLVLTLILVASI